MHRRSRRTAEVRRERTWRPASDAGAIHGMTVISLTEKSLEAALRDDGGELPLPGGEAGGAPVRARRHGYPRWPSRRPWRWLASFSRSWVGSSGGATPWGRRSSAPRCGCSRRIPGSTSSSSSPTRRSRTASSGSSCRATSSSGCSFRRWSGTTSCSPSGPAGTGKTYLAVALAAAALAEKRVRRIVLTRPAVEAGERLGFLPGDLVEKVNPYLRPVYDALLRHPRLRQGGASSSSAA